VRYYLVQIRAAFSHAVPTTQDVMGDRGEMRQSGGSLDVRNEGIRAARLSLSWPQLLDEAAWLRTQTTDWTDSLTQGQLDEQIGWVEFWNSNLRRPDDLPLHVRRTTTSP
jgi:hypothetical protein